MFDSGFDRERLQHPDTPLHVLVTLVLVLCESSRCCRPLIGTVLGRWHALSSSRPHWLYGGPVNRVALRKIISSMGQRLYRTPCRVLVNSQPRSPVHIREEKRSL